MTGAFVTPMCDRSWIEVHAELKAAGRKPSLEQINAHQHEIADVFERWDDIDVYEARLAALIADNAARGGDWTPDTPEQAADRREIAEALLDEQLRVIRRGTVDAED